MPLLASLSLAWQVCKCNLRLRGSVSWVSWPPDARRWSNVPLSDFVIVIANIVDDFAEVKKVSLTHWVTDRDTEMTNIKKNSWNADLNSPPPHPKKQEKNSLNLIAELDRW